jgi:hypothetical protein
MSAPEEWATMSDKEKKLFAQRLVMSERGRYIIGQALAVAVREMTKVEPPHQEVSNIEDMQIIGSMIFSPWYGHYLSSFKM